MKWVGRRRARPGRLSQAALKPSLFTRRNTRVGRVKEPSRQKKARVKKPVFAVPKKRTRAPAKPFVKQAPTSYLLLVCLVVALVTGAFIFQLHIRFEAVRLGYKTSQARASQVRLLGERRELRLELASLKAPALIEAQAREKLGMRMPDYRNIVSVGAKPRSLVASGKAR